METSIRKWFQGEEIPLKKIKRKKRDYKMSKKVPITVARGDGIGPEITDATMRILEAAGAQIDPEYITVGQKAYEQGLTTGIGDDAWASIRKNKILLKGPITTPQGGGFKSVNVTMRKTLGLYANVRPVQTFKPYVKSKHDDVDMVIVRENEEDLYAGIEYRQTRDTCQSVKLLSRSGTERLVRYAFEYARANGRKKVTCLVKDNIMKISDGLFHKVFKLIAEEYPEIEADSMIVDIGMAKVADEPENFDVVVTLNLYGDIVSDIASQVAGSVGLAGSMNVGEEVAMFEAIHGSAPDISGQGIANPSGMLNGAILMLHHIDQSDVAVKIENAWLATLEDETKHTGDIAKDKSKALSTSEFADAVIANLGEEPKKLPVVNAEQYKKMEMPTHAQRTISVREKKHVGVDVFLDACNMKASELGAIVEKAKVDGLEFKLISSRGVKVYPCEVELDVVTDLWRLRYYGEHVDQVMIRDLLNRLENASLDWVKVENLYTYDGEAGFSLLQGE